jgi:hypothetical protein
VAHGFNFYRPGELTLLFEEDTGRFEARQARDCRPLYANLLEELRERLAAEGVALHKNLVEGETGRFVYHPMRRYYGRYDSQSRRMTNHEPRVRALQTVHLEGWQPGMHQSDNIRALSESIEQVNRAAERTQQWIDAAQDKKIPVGEFNLVGVSPHWFGVASTDLESGSPAGQPQKPWDPERPKHFVPDKVRDLIGRLGERFGDRGPYGRPIKVAIFDTWPMDNPVRPLAHIRAFRDRLRQTGIASHRLDQAAVGDIVPEHRIYDYIGRSDLADAPVWRLGCDGRFEDAYRMSDHGLFVADLINDIAPEAEISVYRVLTDWGSTDLNSLRAAVGDAMLDAGDGPLLLNFSMAVGPEIAMTQTLLNEAQQIVLDAQRWSRGVMDKAPSEADRARSNFERQQLQALRWLDQRDRRFAGWFATIDQTFGVDGIDHVLAVAAAGNDSCRPVRLFGPRLPAALEGIIGVSAAKNLEGDLSHYSNANDIFGPNDGTIAFGGEASGGRSTEGLIALYVSDQLPPGVPGGNTHGRAMWAGTSFATPIVTGVAARLWAASPPGTTADQIREAIVASRIDLMQE